MGIHGEYQLKTEINLICSLPEACDNSCSESCIKVTVVEISIYL